MLISFTKIEKEKKLTDSEGNVISSKGITKEPIMLKIENDKAYLVIVKGQKTLKGNRLFRQKGVHWYCSGIEFQIPFFDTISRTVAILSKLNKTKKRGAENKYRYLDNGELHLCYHNTKGELSIWYIPKEDLISLFLSTKPYYNLSEISYELDKVLPPEKRLKTYQKNNLVSY